MSPLGGWELIKAPIPDCGMNGHYVPIHPVWQQTSPR